ncbi:MAG TPA: hypothetical protein VGK99_21660 [Acidobacteriota bacterium]
MSRPVDVEKRQGGRKGDQGAVNATGSPWGMGARIDTDGRTRVTKHGYSLNARTSTPGLHSLAGGWHVAVQPQVHNHLPVDIPGVADKEADDSRARGGSKERRRRPRGLKQRLIRLPFEESDAVVE